MVDLNNNTRRGQQSKKEAQSHRGGEGGRNQETKSDSGEEKTFGGVMGWDLGERGWKRANGWEEAKRGTDEWKGPKKSVSLLRQLSMTIEASGWGGRKGRRDTEQKSQRWALPLSPFSQDFWFVSWTLDHFHVHGHVSVEKHLEKRLIYQLKLFKLVLCSVRVKRPHG